jgi:hypothetical protein
MSTESQPKELLRAVAAHVGFYSSLTGKPFGYVPLDSPDSFWTKGMAQLPKKGEGEVVALLKEIDGWLHKRRGPGDLSGHGILPISNEKGRLWSRIQAHFTSPPDTLIDYEMPVLKRRLRGTRPGENIPA